MSTAPRPVIWGGQRFPNVHAMSRHCNGSAGAINSAAQKVGKYRGKLVRFETPRPTDGQVGERQRTVDVSKVRKLAKMGGTQAQIARVLGFHRGTISRICAREKIECVPGKGGRIGKCSIAKIKQLAAEGCNITEMAEQIGVTPSAVCQFIRRREIDLSPPAQAKPVRLSVSAQSVRKSEARHGKT